MGGFGETLKREKKKSSNTQKNNRMYTLKIVVARPAMSARASAASSSVMLSPSPIPMIPIPLAPLAGEKREREMGRAGVDRVPTLMLMFIRRVGRVGAALAWAVWERGVPILDGLLRISRGARLMERKPDHGDRYVLWYSRV